MARTNTSSATFARTELVKAQFVWLAAHLGPGSGSSGRRTICEAIESRAVRGTGVLRLWSRRPVLCDVASGAGRQPAPGATPASPASPGRQTLGRASRS